MGKLTIPLRAVTIRQPRHIKASVQASEIEAGKELPKALCRVDVTGTLLAIDSDYLFQGTVAGTFEQECDRCLEPAKLVVTLDVAWLFEPATARDDHVEQDFNGIEEIVDVEAEENPLFHFSGDTLDLETAALEELVLAAPSKVYCQEECSGLCPLCGVNWNQGTCECQEEELEVKNTGLSGLKEMFPDLPAGSSEE